MYANHVPVIAGAMRADVATFRRGVLFVVLSIRQPLRRVPGQLAEVERVGWEASGLWGHKLKAFFWLERNCDRLYDLVVSVESPRAAIEALVSVPGLGIVKAAFVAQLMGFDTACLDSRNIRREGRNRRAYRTDGKTAASLAIRRKIADYCVETGRKAEYYWNTWCTEVAEDYDMTPEEVSALHLCIVPDELERIAA